MLPLSLQQLSKEFHHSHFIIRNRSQIQMDFTPLKHFLIQTFILLIVQVLSQINVTYYTVVPHCFQLVCISSDFIQKPSFFSVWKTSIIWHICQDNLPQFTGNKAIHTKTAYISVTAACKNSCLKHTGISEKFLLMICFWSLTINNREVTLMQLNLKP